jgi:hypothetical protein
MATFSRIPNLVDTSCYAIKRAVLTMVGHHWYGQFAADREFYKQLSTVSENFCTSSLYTMNYRLSKSGISDAHFFKEGNKYIQKLYQNKLPWITPHINNH